MSSAYLRLFIFLPANLIPACASSSLAFCMMYSAYNLNKKYIIRFQGNDQIRKFKAFLPRNYNEVMEKGREFQENIYFCFIDYDKAFDFVDHNKLWKILKEMGIPDHLTCLLRNLYAGQEAIVRIGHGPTDWFQIGKGVRQG